MPLFKYRKRPRVNCVRCRRHKALEDPATGERRDLCWACALETGSTSWPEDKACRRCWLVEHKVEAVDQLCDACRREVVAGQRGKQYVTYTKQ